MAEYSKLQAGEVRISRKDGKEMVYVPSGPFLYRSTRNSRYAGITMPTPPRLGVKVNLPAFWIDKTPVTNGEYARFVEATGHARPRHWRGTRRSHDIADHPVVHVSWHDAAAYCAWAGKRLPTDPEWEKAALGTDERIYPWGEEWQAELCNTSESRIGGTTPVGRYSPAGDSPYGCVDMAGNVWEWTDTWAGQGQRQVMRGGAWDFVGLFTQMWYKAGLGYMESNGGFRCCVGMV